MEFRFDIPTANDLITNGEGGAGRAIRRWFRQGQIVGASQREKNAKIWLNAQGVQDAWLLWARHLHLDPETDMPGAVRDLGAQPAHLRTAPSLLAEPGITVIVPPGTTVRILQSVI
jgi:hypothetical protein